jgi:hypothetical protein
VLGHNEIDLGCVVERVERADIALARHAKYAVDAVPPQGIDQKTAAGPPPPS